MFLDLLGVTPAGRIVLVECKLWRNPQARREVVAQVPEYASLLQDWSYGDLIARLIATKRLRGSNPIYDLVREAASGLTEADLGC